MPRGLEAGTNNSRGPSLAVIGGPSCQVLRDRQPHDRAAETGLGVDRVAGKAGAAATFTFTPTAGGAGPADVTLSYPSGFFVSSTPTATHSAAGATLTPAAPGATSIVIAISGTALAASSLVTVTLAGLTMGAETAGGDVKV